MGKLAPRFLLTCVGMMVATQAQAFDFSSLFSQWTEMFNRKISALKVVTKQHAVAAEKNAIATRDSMSALATSYVHNRQAQAVRDTVERFSDQGVFACFQNDIASQVAKTIVNTERAQQSIAAKMQSADYGDDGERRAAQVVLHKAVYCSISEHKAGLCKTNIFGLQSADSDFSFLFDAGTHGISGRAAGYDFVDNIIPVQRAVACKTAECQVGLADVRMLNAADSLARNSLLSMIEARSVQSAE